MHFSKRMKSMLRYQIVFTLVVSALLTHFTLNKSLQNQNTETAVGT